MVLGGHIFHPPVHSSFVILFRTCYIVPYFLNKTVMAGGVQMSPPADQSGRRLFPGSGHRPFSHALDNVGGNSMRAVVQRVTRAEVRIGGRISAAIGPGLLVLLGAHRDDTARDVQWTADKLVHLRIFDDSSGRMNLSLLDTGLEMLIVSQFTLLGDCRKGRRPSWSSAAAPETARSLYLRLIQAVGRYGVRTATGEFQAAMDVSLVNNGPVTIMLDSHDNL